MTRIEKAARLRTIYDIAKSKLDSSTMLQVVMLASKENLSLNKVDIVKAKKEALIESGIEPSKQNLKFPNPFDDVKLAEAIKDDMPKQRTEIKEVPTIFPEQIQGFYKHTWTESDRKAILFCMDKPMNHSYRALDNIKAKIDKRVTMAALRSKLNSMGIRVKKGRALWFEEIK
jgi:hypothetical protein